MKVEQAKKLASAGKSAEQIRAAEKTRIANLAQTLRAACGKQPLDGPGLQMWVRMWWPFSSERLEEAIDKMPKNQKWMPSPGELCQLVMHKPPSQIHGAIDRWLCQEKPDRSQQGLGWFQPDLDEAAEALGLPKGIVKQGEI